MKQPSQLAERTMRLLLRPEKNIIAPILLKTLAEPVQHATKKRINCKGANLYNENFTCFPK